MEHFGGDRRLLGAAGIKNRRPSSIVQNFISNARRWNTSRLRPCERITISIDLTDILLNRVGRFFV